MKIMRKILKIIRKKNKRKIQIFQKLVLKVKKKLKKKIQIKNPLNRILRNLKITLLES